MSEINVFPLFSGSKGNCTLVSSNGTNILIDAGCGKMKTGRKLKEIGLSFCDIDGILITHCHSDHTKYLSDIEDLSNAFVYCKKSVASKVKDMIFEKNEKVISIDGSFNIKDLCIVPFELPHDEECIGYKISSKNESFSYLTDLGYFDDTLFPLIEGSLKILIESNHDEDMLKNGNYPYLLKRRIMSSGGHLSNAACANVCGRLYKSGTKEFILGHLSEENNCPELAYNTVNAVLSEIGDDYSLFVTTRNGLEKPI